METMSTQNQRDAVFIAKRRDILCGIAFKRSDSKAIKQKGRRDEEVANSTMKTDNIIFMAVEDSSSKKLTENMWIADSGVICHILLIQANILQKNIK